jgi:hypothetical protein
MLGFGAILSHYIAAWRATVFVANGLLELAPGRAMEELPEDGMDPLVEIMRRYPDLPRGIAEYLAR